MLKTIEYKMINADLNFLNTFEELGTIVFCQPSKL